MYPLKKQGRLYWVFGGGIFLCLVGALDYFTGTEISFSLFYVFPIALISWASNWKLGAVSSLIGAVLWLGAEFFAGEHYSHPAILYWNTTVRLGIFLLIPYLIKIGRELEHVSMVARTDFVTGAFNSRYFQERLQSEIERSSRYAHSFTLVYLDVDNFKTINDRFGHSVGDKVLRTIVKNIQQTLRKTDVVARMGGDEFSALLPETDMRAAQVVISKVHESLLDEMSRNHWPVTVSIGVITFMGIPASTDSALDMVDKLMYEVKKNGKDNILFAVHKGLMSIHTNSVV
jgi:diguanylate cyclase (GGDEF)-like protein